MTIVTMSLRLKYKILKAEKGSHQIALTVVVLHYNLQSIKNLICFILFQLAWGLKGLGVHVELALGSTNFPGPTNAFESDHKVILRLCGALTLNNLVYRINHKTTLSLKSGFIYILNNNVISYHIIDMLTLKFIIYES